MRYIKFFIGFMMIAVLPLLSLVHLCALVLCMPFILVHATLESVFRLIKELFDLRNTYAFAKGIADQAYKLMGGDND